MAQGSGRSGPARRAVPARHARPTAFRERGSPGSARRGLQGQHTSGTAGLARFLVRGYRRVPAPPPRMMPSTFCVGARQRGVRRRTRWSRRRRGAWRAGAAARAQREPLAARPQGESPVRLCLAGCAPACQPASRPCRPPPPATPRRASWAARRARGRPSSATAGAQLRQTQEPLWRGRDTARHAASAARRAAAAWSRRRAYQRAHGGAARGAGLHSRHSVATHRAPGGQLCAHRSERTGAGSQRRRVSTRARAAEAQQRRGGRPTLGLVQPLQPRLAARPPRPARAGHALAAPLACATC